MAKKKGISSFFADIDPDALDLLNHLLVFNPNNRYTA